MLATTIDTRKNYLHKIAQEIVETKQYPQLRAIVARESTLPAGLSDFRSLAKRTRRPVISITIISTRPITPAPVNEIWIRLRNRYMAAHVFGLNAESARELLLVGAGEKSPMPEAVRISEMIAAKL